MRIGAAMPKPVNIYDAKTNFSKLIERVEAGETVVIARNNVPIAELRPIHTTNGDVVTALRALREEIAAQNGGEPLLQAGETWHDLIHGDHRY
jgi:prevent-host-death family protein